LLARSAEATVSARAAVRAVVHQVTAARARAGLAEVGVRAGVARLTAALTRPFRRAVPGSDRRLGLVIRSGVGRARGGAGARVRARERGRLESHERVATHRSKGRDADGEGDSRASRVRARYGD